MSARREVLLTLALALLTASVTAAETVYSNPTEVRPLLVGAEVPAVSVHRPDGESFDLQAAVRSKPTVLIFYRGGW